MKKNIIIAAFAFLAVLTGCNKETPAPSSQEEGISSFVTFSGSLNTITKTSFSGEVGGDLRFLWTEGDYIVLSDGITCAKSNELRKSEAGKNSADFLIDTQGLKGDKSSWTVFYPGQNGIVDGNFITARISSMQSQTGVGGSNHLGYSGDCGFCKGENITLDSASGRYGFTITHAVAYLCFLPYVDKDLSGAALDGCKIRMRRVSVSSTKSMSGVYALSTEGITTVNSGNTADTTKLTKGFYLANNLEGAKEQGGVYMAVAPQKHADIEVQYYVDYYDVEGTPLSLQNTIVRKFTDIDFEAGKVYYVTCHMREKELKVVDLGTNGVWSVANVGASSPVDAGDRYAWGACAPANVTDSLASTIWEESFPWGHWNSPNDYNIDHSFDTQIKHDPVFADEENWGNSHGWRMPTFAEMMALPNDGKVEWAANKGQKCIGSNGNSIFIPYNGRQTGTTAAADVNTIGFYWTTNRYTPWLNNQAKHGDSYLTGTWYGYADKTNDALGIRPIMIRPVLWNQDIVDLAGNEVEDIDKDSIIW